MSDQQQSTQPCEQFDIRNRQQSGRDSAKPSFRIRGRAERIACPDSRAAVSRLQGSLVSVPAVAGCVLDCAEMHTSIALYCCGWQRRDNCRCCQSPSQSPDCRVTASAASHSCWVTRAEVRVRGSLLAQFSFHVFGRLLESFWTWRPV